MKFVIRLLLLFACLLSLAAQESDDREAREVRGRRAWFVATAIPDGLENPVAVLTGEDLVQVTLSKRMASGPVKIPADGLIRIVREVPNPDGAAEPAYLTLARARIPETMAEALIILIPVGKKESNLVYRAKIQDLASFTGGDHLYLNLTTANIAVQLGTAKIALKPGVARIYDAPALEKSTNVPVSYQYFHPTQKKWKLLSASTIVLRSTRREICVFSWDPRYERVSYHGITFPVTR
jgi:hypothetical protein